MKCAAVIGILINLIYLLASFIEPYLPDTAKSINTQLDADLLPIPSHWAVGSIAVGHKIGKSEHLFSRIKPEKAEEWRKTFGSSNEV